MNIYIVDQIMEADFGCEESNRTEPMVLLKLKGISENADPKRYLEYPDRKLIRDEIDEGHKVIINDESFCFRGDTEAFSR